MPMINPSLLDVFSEVIGRLEANHLPYMVVGSMASMVYGEPRLTKDLYLWSGFAAVLASPEDVILKKLDFFREGGSHKHLLDIKGILTQTDIDNRYLDEWVENLGLKLQWEMAKQI